MQQFNYASAMRDFAAGDKKDAEEKKAVNLPEQTSKSSTSSEETVDSYTEQVRQPKVPEKHDNTVDLRKPRFDIGNQADIDDFKNNNLNINSVNDEIIDVPVSSSERYVSSFVQDVPIEESDTEQDEPFEPDMSEEAEALRRENEAQLREQTEQYNKHNVPNTPKIIRRAVKTSDDADSVSVVKNVPTCLVQHIKSMFPSGVTQGEAIAAYIYIKEGRLDELQVPDRIREVADLYMGDTSTLQDVKMDFEAQMRELKQKYARIFSKLESIELGVVYTIFDRMGFRKEDMTDPGAINFLEGRIAEMVKKLDSQAAQQHMKDAVREGRPKR